MRLLVVGPGALGTLFAVRLALAGHEVVVQCRTAATAKHIQRHGLRLEDGSTRTAPVDAALHPEGPFDGVVLATKIADLDAVAAGVARHGAPVVALQNGVVGDQLAVLGDLLVDGTVGFPATLLATGHSRATGRGSIHIGPWPRGGTGPGTPTHEVAGWLQAVAPIHASDNMEGVKWTKLVINSTVSIMGAVAGMATGPLLARRDARDVVLRLAEEARRVGEAAGVHFEPLAGFHVHRLRSLGRLGSWAPHALLRVMGRRFGDMESSPWQDLQRGRTTEVRELNGFIAATGRRHGVATPGHDAVLAAVEAMEVGTEVPGPKQIHGILRAFS